MRVRDSFKKTERRGTLRRWPRRVSAGALASLAVLIVLSATASGASAEVETHSFDAVHSLRGDCGTDKTDPVADPGCPYLAPPSGPERFNSPKRVVADAEGNIYVVSGSFEAEHLDVFDAEGEWLFSESKAELVETLGDAYPALNDPEASFVEDLEVDSSGNLYVALYIDPKSVPDLEMVVRFTPSASPSSGATVYEDPFVVFEEHGPQLGVAVDSLDRLYIGFGNKIDIYESAQNSNTLIKAGVGQGVLSNSANVAVGPGPAFDIYASGLKPGVNPIPTADEPFVGQVYVFDRVTGAVKEVIDGSDVPNCTTVTGEERCGFKSSFASLDVVVSQSNGDVYVGDLGSASVYQFSRDEGTGEYVFLSRIEHFFQHAEELTVGLDNGSTSPNLGYLYVVSHSSGIGHVYAFRPKLIAKAPEITGQRVSGISETEALLEAEINPSGGTTTYWFEYVEEAIYREDVEKAGSDHGFDHALRAPAPAGSLGSGGEAVSVSQSISGLEPGTTYRFRAVAESCDPAEPERPCTTEGEGKPGEEGADSRFATFPAQERPQSCPNEVFRTGFSAALPDCRAFELVTPPDTNGLAPIAFTIGVGGTAWSSPLASPSGDSVLFVTGGGSLPGYNGSGSLNADGYRARRNPASGWRTEAAGPSGVQSQAPRPGSFSSDHDYWIWKTFLTDEGSLGNNATYLRRPDHVFELLGQGSLNTDPEAAPRWISAGGTHRIFSSKVKLEENAPPGGTEAIYDRTSAGITHVVSLLPGGVPQGAGEHAAYQGAAADGTAVAFKVGESMFVRVDNAQTLLVTAGPSTFAGLSQDGSRLFYVQGGNIFSFDTSGSKAATKIGSGGESTVVNASADGSAIYFVSPKRLDGVAGQLGKDNLYAWDESTGTIDFIAVLEHSDVTGEELVGGPMVGGLGLWTSHVVSPSQGQFFGRLSDPSRTTPDGGVFVFESRANLTDYNANGHREIYRYEATGNLVCISCDPTLTPATADMKLVSTFDEGGILNPLADLANLSDDGQRVFFESLTALVARDVDGVRDVYEWRAEGVDACTDPDGCLALISSGQSSVSSHLYGITPDGHDVFIRTADVLLPADWDATPSIYDARIGGGFAEASSSECPGDACKGRIDSPPNLPSAGSEGLVSPGNRAKVRRCPKGKRKVRRAGKVRCVKRVKAHRHKQGPHAVRSSS
jgi:hypothetical protein